MIRTRTIALVVTPLIAAAAVACNTKGADNRDDIYTSTATPTPGPQPKFPSPVTATTPPPPISGGTMVMAEDGKTVIASDPDRDQIYVVDLPSRTVTHTIALAAGSEPGRVAVDGKGHAFVALRGSGNMATVDIAAGTSSEQHLCVAPRGLAFDAAQNMVHVACAEGYLVSVPLAGGNLRRIALDRDLRDVIVTKTRLLVSRFRDADVLTISPAGEYTGKHTSHGGNLAWRMIAMPESKAAPVSGTGTTTGDDSADAPAIVSQDPNNPGGVVANGYYGSAGPSDACSAPTITQTRLDLPGASAPIFIPPAVLPVDLATNGHELTIVAAGNGHTPDLPQIFTHTMATASSAYDPSGSGSGGFSGSSSGYGAINPDCEVMAKGFIPGQAIAAVYDGDDELVVQSREPASLYIMSPDRQRVLKTITLSTVSREDTGHALFHSNSGGFLACASCHAEGGDDARTWTFIEGERRTPSMRGTIANTAPYHWDGEMKNLRDLVDHVFVTRMSGPAVDDTQLATLQSWLFAIPAPKAPDADPDVLSRGRTLFLAHGCTTCHSGTAFTNNESHDVGTGGVFQVPSLIGVGWRAPFLHNGCAKTLKDRFGACGGGDQHGDTSTLSPADIDDLVGYLESL